MANVSCLRQTQTTDALHQAAHAREIELFSAPVCGQLIDRNVKVTLQLGFSYWHGEIPIPNHV